MMSASMDTVTIKQICILAIFGAFIYLVTRLFLRSRLLPSSSRRRRRRGASRSWPTVHALTNFNYAETPPIKHRPFQPTYNLSMALQRCDPSTLVVMDSTYLERINLRRQLMKTHREVTLGANAIATSAVAQLYDWLMPVYLPTRFPDMFQLRRSQLYAKVTDETFPAFYDIVAQNVSRETAAASAHDPAIAAATTAEEALRTLSSIIDMEFAILLPRRPQSNDERIGYVLEADALVSPNGFNTRFKLSLPLAAIHGPVRGYAKKLEKSMDRYFERLKVGKWVQLSNWSVQTHDQFYVPGDEEGGVANHFRPGQKPPTETPPVYIDRCRLRCESQKLFRMPGGAIVFAFKTYLYLLEDVKAEGKDVAERLAEAIEGMRKGNVPDVWWYKKGFEWGGSVVDYLREGWD